MGMSTGIAHLRSTATKASRVLNRYCSGAICILRVTRGVGKYTKTRESGLYGGGTKCHLHCGGHGSDGSSSIETEVEAPIEVYGAVVICVSRWSIFGGSERCRMWPSTEEDKARLSDCDLFSMAPQTADEV